MSATATSSTTAITTKEKILIAIDVEFEHEDVAHGNCLQLAFVAFRENLTNPHDASSWLIDTLSVCFEPQPGALQNSNIMNFWGQFPDVYSRILREARPVKEQMVVVQTWLNQLAATFEFTFVADIANVDFAWVKTFILNHCDEKERKFTLPYKCLCLNSMEYALITMQKATKRELKERCTNSVLFPHTHYALDDAMECAFAFLQMRKNWIC